MNTTNSPDSNTKKLYKSRINLTHAKTDQFAAIGLASGIATISFAIIGKKNVWLDKETSARIGLTGLGLTLLSAVPSIAKNLDQEIIADSIISNVKTAFLTGENYGQ